MDIRSDRQKGLSYVELGKKFHMDQRTAKRYAESPQKPVYALTGPKPSEPFPVFWTVKSGKKQSEAQDISRKLVQAT